jgi:AcrR family transcriptional regulator
MNTRDKILESARLLFMKHGLEGVKMQMVADDAGVNKGLLHYYYKSKAKIFTEVFNRVTNELFKDVASLFSDDSLSSDEKISRIVDAYFKLLNKNRYLPVFFISEMNRDPEILKRLGFGEKIKSLMNGAQPMMPKGKSPEFGIHFMITLISLSAFPFMISPLINEITEDNKQTDVFLDERKEFVKTTLKNMLK